MDTDAQITAFHEAGHAIAADELGAAYYCISIVPGEEHAGAVGAEGDDCFLIASGTAPSSPENEAGDHQAIIDYAGHAAVVALLGKGDMTEESAILRGAGPDFERASHLLQGDAVSIASTKAKAIELVKRRRSHIEAVAAALLRRGRLDPQQAEWIMLHGEPLPDFLEY